MAYTSLDSDKRSIRLMYLNPASTEDETIRCRFTVASLDDNPQYEALSYVWGDVNDTRSIEVDGHSAPITANLHLALRHLRLQNQQRTLWVDALCINQSNNQEKTQQVSLMSSVYGQASQVVVWLGEGWPGSDMAMEFLRKLGEGETLHMDPSLNPNISVSGLKLDSMELRGHVIRLFDLPWWKRTWTVQECVLAQNLVFQCSKSLVTREMMFMVHTNFWNHVRRCCMDWEANLAHLELQSSLRGGLERLSSLVFVSRNRARSYSVLSGIASFCKQQATDPRDKVYGMLGLGIGTYSNLVQPDYTLTPEQVCEAVAIQSVERTNKLEFLSHLFEHHNPKLPSFIPNWTGPFEWDGVYESRLNSVNMFDASLGLPAQLELISHAMLSTRGVVFDTVLATIAASPLDSTSGLQSFERLHRLAGLENSAEELYCHTGDSRLLAFGHTLSGGAGSYQRDSDHCSERLSGSTDLSRYYEWAAFITAPPQSRAELWNSNFFLSLGDIHSATSGRHFFTTKKGYFGFAPRKTKEGDLIVVLAGGDVPYIIRPVSRAEQTHKIFGSSITSETATKLFSTRFYNILGDAYVHGIMDGEVFELLNPTERELREIVLV